MSLERARSLANNPAAAAQAFDVIVRQFTDTLAGFKRANRRGLFGRVRHYYGVVEAQARGSLHLHVLFWLEGAPSPQVLRDRCRSEDGYRDRVFRWLEDIIKQDLPPGTRELPSDGDRKRTILSRPLDPAHPEFDALWEQVLRDILDASNQTHTHGPTCFKHMSAHELKSHDPDRDCRFNLPREVVLETHIDDEGKIHLRCHNGAVNGYNDIMTLALGCNTDMKHIGSGTFGQAVSMYITNYVAKISLDSAVVISALNAGLQAVNALGADRGLSGEERTRTLLFKTLNQMVGKRELSGQQVASALLDIPNRYTDATFATVYWSPLLSWLAPNVFIPFKSVVKPPEVEELGSDSDDDSTSRSVLPSSPPEPFFFPCLTLVHSCHQL